MAILSNQRDQFQLQLNRYKKNCTINTKHFTMKSNRKKTIDYQQENNNKQLFVISRIIKVEVGVINRDFDKNRI